MFHLLVEAATFYWALFLALRAENRNQLELTHKGVYTSVKVSLLFFEIRKQTGRSQNALPKFTTGINEFKTDRLLARWASRCPVDGHFLKKIILLSICCLIVHLCRAGLIVHFGRPLFKPGQKPD